jgi:fibronectin type III domain protein
MKVTPRFIVRAALVVTAGGVIGAFGACKDSSSPNPPPPPPPPPPVLVAPAAPTLTAVDTTKISLAWTYSDTTITGFRLDRCSGAGCANFAQVGTNMAKTLRAYTDTGLAVRTSYSYRIRALRGSDTSAWSPSATLTTGSSSGGSASFIMVGAGEIATGNSDAGPTATAKLVNDILTANPGAIAFTIGNNFTDPNASTFAGTRFDGTWGLASTGVGGTFKDRTYYALGNNDFSTNRGPSAVYSYFGSNAGPADKGWYSFDKGSWHIVVLNTSDWQHGADSTFGITSTLVRVPSAQIDWLTADLANTTQKCIAVISWERRFFTTSGGTLGFNSNMKPIGQIMYDNGVDLLISAKDKLYSRFTQLNSETHTPDPKGFREFIVGTGGRTNDGKPAGTPAEREAYIGRDTATSTPDQWGVLKLTLGDGTYSWEFVNTNPAGPTDKSDAPVSCH